jgi:hypothetical protein
MRHIFNGSLVLLTLVFGLSACGSGSSPFTQSESAAEHQQFGKSFQAAAAANGIPVGLLEAMAYVSTHWHPANTSAAAALDVTDIQVFGIMGLHNDSTFGHSLTAAAALIGKSPAELVASTNLNIAGAAALLALEAKNMGVSGAGVEMWADVVRTFSGIPTVAEADSYIADVYTVLKNGVDENGIMIPARPALAIPAPKGTVSDPGVSTDVSGGYAKPAVTWAPSPNFNAGALGNPRYIIIHDTEGSFADSVSWLRSPSSGVSAHYVIQSRDGAIKQLVQDQDEAWHARCWNSEAIGIEHEGFMASPGKYYTDVMYRASANLVRYLTAKYNIPRTNIRIVGHNARDMSFFSQTGLSDCNTHEDPGPGWDWTKYLGFVASATPI